MNLAHRIRLIPTERQEGQFRRACGVSRFAYNWALAEWRRQRAAGEKPSESALRKKLNALKRADFPWMGETTKNAPQQAIKNLGRAYANFFEDLKKARNGAIALKRVRVPRFKKKGVHDAFRADNGTDVAHPNAVRARGKRIFVPRIGWVKMREEVRFAGNISSVVISRRADAWYASVTVEFPSEHPIHALSNTIGVDLGVSHLATTSDGAKTPSPKPLRKFLKRLRRLSRSLSRKQRRSKNRAKAKTKLARLHRRIAEIRTDALHQCTTRLVRSAGTLVIEDLGVTGMLRNRRLSRAIADIGFFEFRRQLEYKSAMAGSKLILALRWYPSSKSCSRCGVKNVGLALSERTWTCSSCGTPHDRDVNAAVNLARYAEGLAASACGTEGAGGGPESRRETSGAEAGRFVHTSHDRC